MSAAPEAIPTHVYGLPLGQRIRWARKRVGLSHDRLVERLGRSNRGHLIKVEQGDHLPREDLRDALADALGVPRELFADDPQEAAPSGATFREGDGHRDVAARAASRGRQRGESSVTKDAA